MSTRVSPTTAWRTANQRHIAAAVGSVRGALARHAGRAPAEADDPTEQPSASTGADPAPAGSPPMALDFLANAFRLSAFERDVLVMCAGMELDASFAELCGAANGSAQRAYPTFSLALAALPNAHWSAIAPNESLRYWRLVQVGAGSALTTSPLRIDERVLHFLTGVAATDDKLDGIVRPIGDVGALAPSQQQVVDRLAATWLRPAHGLRPIVHLYGDAWRDARNVVATAARSIGLQPWVLAADALPADPADAEVVSRAWQREAALSGAALLIEDDELDSGEAARTAFLRFVDGLIGAVAVASRERRPLGRRAAVLLDLSRPRTDEQIAMWRVALGPIAGSLNGRLEQLGAQFRLGRPAIDTAVVDARARSTADDDEELGRELWDACRRQTRPRLEELAQRIEPTASWDDLVLPAAEKQILRDIAAHVRQRATVYETWGFARRGSRGLGISALFAGASGTGKTMAAEVLANEMRLDVYRIDLSAVVSKYIGETEKNLRRVFDAAEDGGAILLFDEADALFGKRSEVKDSHDRYANIEVSYLLQRMECYRGLAILTTNLKNSLDTAFLRRIRFVVQFPFPDPAQRAEIWRRVLPVETPTEGLDPERLARLNVAGGSIRNIALGAAFLAADVREPVRMTHLLRAARSEYAKLERALTDAETGGWE